MIQRRYLRVYLRSNSGSHTFAALPPSLLAPFSCFVQGIIDALLACLDCTERNGVAQERVKPCIYIVELHEWMYLKASGGLL